MGSTNTAMSRFCSDRFTPPTDAAAVAHSIHSALDALERTAATPYRQPLQQSSALEDQIHGELVSAILTLTRGQDDCSSKSEAVQAALGRILHQIETDGLDGLMRDDPRRSGDVPSNCPWLADLPIAQYQAPPGPLRVFVDGCFDVTHSGHYNMLRQAKAKGDWLVVGVHSDEEILRNKGPTVMNDQERLAVVRACKWVDEVVFDTPYSPEPDFIDSVNCSYCAHGDDISKGVFDAVILAGRFKLLKRTEGVSTTDLVGRLLTMSKSSHIDYEGGDQTAANCTKLLSQTTHQDEDDAHYARSAGVEFMPSAWRMGSFANNRVAKPTDRVVYIDGGFDLFHAGHVQALEKTLELGNFVLVGVWSDAAVHAKKGLNWPIMALLERVLNVVACKHVDDVVIGAPRVVTQDMINTFNISVVAGEAPIEIQGDTDPYLIPKQLGIYKQLPAGGCGLRTSDVGQRIIDAHTKFAKRNESRSKKELEYYGNSKQYVADAN